MKLLKLALAAMGLMIIVGFIFVGYVSYQRLTGTGYFGKGHSDGPPPEVVALLAGPTPVAVALGLPNDAKVETIHDVGNRVLLLVRQASFGDRLYLLDPRTGAVTTAIGIGQVVPPLPAPMPGTANP